MGNLTASQNGHMSKSAMSWNIFTGFCILLLWSGCHAQAQEWMNQKDSKKALQAESLLQSVFPSPPNGEIVLNLIGLTEESLGVQKKCTVEISNSIDNDKVLLFKVRTGELNLDFNLDRLSDPKIMLNTSDEVILRQTDHHTRVAGFGKIEFFQNYSVHELLQIERKENQITAIDLVNDKTEIRCVLSPTSGEVISEPISEKVDLINQMEDDRD